MTTNEAFETTTSTTTSSDTSTETYVVVSKVKKLIRDNSGMNTAKDAIDAFSQRVAQETARAIENARTAGRKTVMGRDIIDGETTTTATEALVVVSKVKKLIRDASGFNTSKDAVDALSQKIATEATRAIENARTAGRKTVMARDVLA